MKRNLYTLIIMLLVVCSSVFAQNKTVVFVGPALDEASDKDYQTITAILTHGGYDVTELPVSTLLAEDLPVLNAADVVIMGRSINSSDVGTSKDLWDQITSPVISMNMYGIRNTADKAYWVATEGGTTENVVGDENAVIEAVLAGDDAVFGGLSGTITWWNGRYAAFLPDTDMGNATVLATSTDGRPLFARWAANEPFYVGADHSPSGERTFIGCGQDNTQPNIYFGFSPDATNIFFAELARMASGATAINKVDKAVSSLSVFVNNSRVSISMDGLDRVEIYSLSGQKLVSERSESNKLEFSPALNTGIYIVKAYDKTGSSAADKFMLK